MVICFSFLEKLCFLRFDFDLNILIEKNFQESKLLQTNFKIIVYYCNFYLELKLKLIVKQFETVRYFFIDFVKIIY